MSKIGFGLAVNTRKPRHSAIWTKARHRHVPNTNKSKIKTKLQDSCSLVYKIIYMFAAPDRTFMILGLTQAIIITCTRKLGYKDIVSQ